MSVDNISPLGEQLSPSAYLGKGMAWPPREDLATGDFKKAEAEQSISDCLLHLVTTAVGEIVPMQDYGTLVEHLLFNIGAPSFVESVAASIRDAIELHERRVVLISIQPIIRDNAAGTKTVTINVRYRIIATGKEVEDVVVLPPGQGVR